MLSLESEIAQLRDVLGDSRTDRLIARERREVFSVYPELRLCAWAGAVLLASAAGLVLKNNLDRIGPLALSVGIAVAAASCYAVVWVRRSRAGLVDDYVLLLGALLVSADVAFVETQFKLLGSQWQRHLLLLALVHAGAAYLFRSRMVLSLSITAFAGWLGIERAGLDVLGRDPVQFATRAYLCALLLLVWRWVDKRIAGDRAPEFSPLFEHFAATIALFGGLGLLDRGGTRMAGCLATIAVAAGVIRLGFRRRSEPFVLYAFVFAVIAIDVLIIDTIGTGVEELVMLVIVGSMIAAIAALFAIHSRFRRLRA